MGGAVPAATVQSGPAREGETNEPMHEPAEEATAGEDAKTAATEEGEEKPAKTSSARKRGRSDSGAAVEEKEDEGRKKRVSRTSSRK